MGYTDRSIARNVKRVYKIHVSKEMVRTGGQRNGITDGSNRNRHAHARDRRDRGGGERGAPVIVIGGMAYLLFLFLMWSLCRISALSDAKLEGIYRDTTANN